MRTELDIVALYSLYTATKQKIRDARMDARAGRKDHGRDVLRFVRNSSIITILKSVDFGMLQVDVAHLDWELGQLEIEVHPASEVDQSSDLSAIRASLEVLAMGIQQLLGKEVSK